jgi:hypothetical protein
MQEPTLGEVIRRLDDLRKQVEDLPSKIDSTYVRKDVYEKARELAEEKHVSALARIIRLESRQEWLVRTVGALIIGAVIGVVLGIR